MSREDCLPGDIVLYPVSGKDGWESRIVGIGQLLFGSGRGHEQFSHAALLQLVDEAGVSMPMGSTATLRATGAVAPVGFDGDVYVEDLGPHNELTVEWPNGHRCAVAFDYKPMPGEIPSIGPLRCQEKKP